MADKQIRDAQDLKYILSGLKDKKKIIGFTNGCFDILHIGHIRYMEEAKKHCDILVVAVNSDASVKKLKGDSRPINKQQDRMGVLSALQYVDFVVSFDENTPLNLIEILMPDILFKGGDWKEEEVAGGDVVKRNGGKVMIIKFEEGYSTTGVIKKIKNQ